MPASGSAGFCDGMRLSGLRFERPRRAPATIPVSEGAIGGSAKSEGVLAPERSNGFALYASKPGGIGADSAPGGGSLWRVDGETNGAKPGGRGGVAVACLTD